MPQGMRGNRFAEPRLFKRLPARDLDGARRDRLLGTVTWEQPRFWVSAPSSNRRRSNSLGESITYRSFWPLAASTRMTIRWLSIAVASGNRLGNAQPRP